MMTVTTLCHHDRDGRAAGPETLGTENEIEIVI
jgi:hypothetical protein